MKDIKTNNIQNKNGKEVGGQKNFNLNNNNRLPNQNYSRAKLEDLKTIHIRDIPEFEFENLKEYSIKDIVSFEFKGLVTFNFD